MIKVVKDFTAPPARLTSESCLDCIQDSIISPGTHMYKSYYYRDGSYEQLCLIYNSKCAYCETSTQAGAVLRVDHYRPKGRIDEEPGSRGYYWLGYEWSNLLLACERCNSNKGDSFPIEGERVHTPVLQDNRTVIESYKVVNGVNLLNEKPLLLNPEVDYEHHHFSFEADGKISGLTPQGITTIDICKLNREHLVIDRKRTIDKLFSEVQQILVVWSESNSLDAAKALFRFFFQRLQMAAASTEKYSLLGRLLLEKFNHFFTERFENKQRRAVEFVYSEYINNRL